jgi:polyisoprenyl-phosphate glycosyltransferase
MPLPERWGSVVHGVPMIWTLAELDSSSQEPAVRRPEPALLSVVVPMFNEAATVDALYERLRTTLGDITWELIAVDDGSRDETPDRLRALSARDHRVRVVRLSRNFGHQAALSAGLDHATGDAVVMIDADLQDPPELIPRMVDEWRRGADVVHTVREHRPEEPWWRMFLIRGFYRLFARLARIESVAHSADFRLVDRRVVEILGSMRERHRFLRGMAAWVGFEQARVSYDRDPRYAGKSGYSLRRSLELALDGIVSFSYMPLRFAALIGVLVSIAALIAVPAVIVLKVAGEYVPGFATLTIVLLLLGGVQLLTLGIMGEYLGRSYEEVKRRPVYVVWERYNFPEQPDTAAGGTVMEGVTARQ